MKNFISLMIITFSLLILSNVKSLGQVFIVSYPPSIPCEDMNTANPNEPNCDNIGCDNFNTWVMSDPKTNGQLWTLRSWEEVTLQLYQEFVNGLDNMNKIHLAYCLNLKSDYMATKSSCKSYCIYQHFDPGSQAYLTTIEEVECNEGSCCVYERSYCVDPMTHEIVIEGTTFYEEILQEVGFCDEQQQVQFSTECNNSFNRTIEPCNNNCIEPD